MKKPHNEAEKERARKFSIKIQTLRKKQKISQSELSIMTKIPVDTIRSFETGRIRCPNVFIAYDLVSALKGNLHEIIEKSGGAKK